MSRQDQGNSVDPWLREKSEKEKIKEELREEVISELKRKKRKKTLGCFFLVSLVFLIFLFLSATALAKTGLIEIPFFSKFFYKQPQPIKVVKVEEKEIKSFSQLFEGKIKSQVEKKIILEEKAQKVEVELESTEEELTASLLYEIETGILPLSKAQMAITKNEIEIFGQLKESNIFLTVNFLPEIKNSQIVIKLTKLKLGNLSLPISFSNFLVEKLLKDQTEKINEIISKGGKLEEVKLEDGRIVLKGTIDVIIFLK